MIVGEPKSFYHPFAVSPTIQEYSKASQRIATQRIASHNIVYNYQPSGW